MNRLLTGQTCLVTGGVAGIGRAIVESFVAEGGQVVILDVHSDRAQQAAAELGAAGGIGADVADEAQTQAAVAEAEQILGRVDVLVNSPGLLTQSPVAAMSLAQWRETIDVDLTGVFLMCRAVVPGMVERGHSRVINLASQLAIKGAVTLAHYSAAKAGSGVLVNAIAPGPIETALVGGFSADFKGAVTAGFAAGEIRHSRGSGAHRRTAGQLTGGKPLRRPDSRPQLRRRDAVTHPDPGFRSEAAPLRTR
jgi:3-oxoacyl-[acyl-carrier protein] reductase